jgi:PAS domain S-box-containing protein
MKNNRTHVAQLTMVLLAFVTIGLCARVLEVLFRAEIRPELCFAVALALVSKGRTVYICTLGSLILTCVLGVYEQKTVETIAMMSVWAALTTLVYCTVSRFAIRSFLGNRWRTLFEGKDFITLLVVGSVLTSLIPAAFELTALTFRDSSLSANRLVVELIRLWQEIALGALIFLPVFIGLLLRNTAAWRTRYKAITISGLVLLGSASYLALTEKQITTFVANADLAQQTIGDTTLIAYKIAETEGIIMGFSQIAEISSTAAPTYLSQLSQHIFSLHPSIRSLSVVVDTAPDSLWQGVTKTSQGSLEPLSTNVPRYRVSEFFNPNYPKTPINLDLVSQYMSLPMARGAQREAQRIPSFSLVRYRDSEMIVVHQAQYFDDATDLDRAESLQGKPSVFIDIDVSAFLATENMFQTANLPAAWAKLELGIAQLPKKQFAPPLSYRLSSPEIAEQRELSTLRLFDQDFVIRATPSRAWLEAHVRKVVIPITFLKMFFVSLYMLCVFFIATRQTRWRLLFTKQGLTLDRQVKDLNLFKQSIENAKEEIAILESHGNVLRIVYANHSYCKMANQLASELTGSVWSTFVAASINEQEVTKIRQAVAQGISCHLELMAINQRSDWRWLDLTLTPIQDNANSTSHWVLTQQDISDRKKTELELQRVALEASNLSATKSRFLANMSHEIRTPLSGIIGLTHLVEETHDPQLIQQHLQTIRTSAQLQLEIITSILNALKIESAQIYPTIRRIHLSVLLGQTIDMLRPNAQLKNIALNVKISNNIPAYIESDPLFLKQILLNLLGNAIKFTKKGQINIAIDFLSSKEQSIELRFSVADSGVGLGSLSLDKITKPFFKGDLDEDVNTEGLGLGLAIAEAYLQQMGSHLQVISSNSFGGATFYFDLHCQYSNQDREPTVQADAKHPNPGFDSSRNIFIDLRFLLIEDNLINQIVMMGYLKDSGATIDIASNGNSALSKIEANQYDLVLLDLRIPKFDTATIAMRLKHFSETSNRLRTPPIIGISASQQDSYVDTLKQFGLSDFLTKPIDQAQLFGVIKKHVALKPLKTEVTHTPNVPVIAQNRKAFSSDELQQLFLEQALDLRPQFDKHFYAGAHESLSEALHFLQGSAAALDLLDLQQAALNVEESMRTQSDSATPYLSFIRLYDRYIDLARESLSATTNNNLKEAPPSIRLRLKEHTHHFDVLLVDDNELVAHVLGQQITAKSLRVDFAYSSEEALLKLDTHRYDILVTDLVLPDMDGLTLTKIISTQSRFNDIIIFGLSAYVSDAIAQECKAVGMKHLFSKLSNPDLLIATLVETVDALNNRQR